LAESDSEGEEGEGEEEAADGEGEGIDAGFDLGDCAGDHFFFYY
jgi:hypothetical protein